MLVHITQKNWKSLKPGAYIMQYDNSDIRITSKWDWFHDWYECEFVEVNEDGEETSVGSGVITSGDLFGHDVDEEYLIDPEEEQEEEEED